MSSKFHVHLPDHRKLAERSSIKSKHYTQIGLFQKKSTPLMDGILEILTERGVKDPGNPGRRGG